MPKLCQKYAESLPCANYLPKKWVPVERHMEIAIIVTKKAGWIKPYGNRHIIRVGIRPLEIVIIFFEKKLSQKW